MILFRRRPSRRQRTRARITGWLADFPSSSALRMSQGIPMRPGRLFLELEDLVRSGEIERIWYSPESGRRRAVYRLTTSARDTVGG